MVAWLKRVPILLLLGCSGCRGEWSEYVSKDGQFSVLMPSEPRVSIEEHASGRQGKAYCATERPSVPLTGGTSYCVEFFDLEPEVVADDAFFSMIRRTEIEVDGATVVAERGIDLDGKAAREYDVRRSSRRHYLIRVFVAQSRVYILSAGSFGFGYRINGAFFETFRPQVTGSH